MRVEWKTRGDDYAPGLHGKGSDENAEALLRRMAHGDGMELRVAEHQGSIVSAGRLESAPGADFAGIWGGQRGKSGAAKGYTVQSPRPALSPQ